MSVRSVMHIDLSYNSVHEAGAAAISSYFGRKNVLRYLDVSNCNLDGGDIKDICKSLITYKNCLEEFYLSCNKILADGANGKTNLF